MSLTSAGAEPQPSLAWQFENSNVDSVNSLQPSAQVSPGPAQLQGSAALVTTVAGVSNTAVYFPGTGNDYMNLGISSPTNFDLKTSNCFIEAWCYIGDSGGYLPISSKAMIPSGTSCWLFSITNSKIDLRIKPQDFSVAFYYCTGSTTITSGRWYHFAFSYVSLTSTTGTMYVFVDGVSDATGVSFPSPGPLFDSNIPYTIGNSRGSIANGYIRDLRVVQGGVVPVATFTPGAAPFSYASPTYVANMGTTVFTLLGQFVTYVPGKYNQAINFTNGTNGANYITTGTLPVTLSNTVGFTCSFWINFNPAIGSNQYPLALYNGDTSKLVFYFVVTTGLSAFRGDGATRTGAAAANMSLVPSASTWYHMALTVTNTTWNAYINGAIRPEASGAYTSANLTNINGPLWIGASSGLVGLTGLIDDLRIYNTALTAAQIQSVYSSQGAPAPSRAMPLPKLAWTFELSNVDSVSSLAPTTSVGPPTYNSSGKYGSSIVFNNTPGAAPGEYYLTYKSGISLSTETGFTICVWIKPLALGVNSTGVQRYLTIYDGNVTFFDFQTVTSASSVSFYGQNPFTPPQVIISGADQSAIESRWIHCTVVFIGSSIQTYYNGVNKDTLSLTNFPITFNALSLANRSAVNSGDTAAKCEIDDLRIFDRSLTSSQVQSIYNQQGVPGRAVQTLAYPYDNVGITSSAAGLWSTRRLRSAYAGPVVNVRRNSDNAQLDFIADQFGNLSNVQSAVTIDTWLASTTGNVTTLYDQFRSNNFTQATATSQPQIVKNSGKWVVFFNRDNLSGTPTFYSRMTIPNQISGIKTILYGINTGTGSVSETLLGRSGFDNAGFRMSGGYFFSGTYGNDINDFLYTGGRDGLGNGYYLTYWYNNNRYGSSVNRVNFNNPTGQWGLVIGSTPGYTSFGFNSLSDPQSSLTSRAFYGYLSEVAMFTEQVSQVDAGSLYAAQYISRTSSTTLTGTPLFTQLSPSATSSAVGAFSLRAVNGTSARAVQVQAHPVVQWPPIAMTSNNFTATGTYNGIVNGVYTATSTGTIAGGTEFKLFDGDINTWYASPLTYNISSGVYNGSNNTTISSATVFGEWVQINLPTRIILRRYELVGRQDASQWQQRMPTTFWIAGSNDSGSTWSNVHQQSGLTPPQSGITINVPSTSNSISYSSYRLVVNVIGYSGGSRDTLNFSSWNLYGDAPSYAPSAAQDFYADRLGNLLTAPVTGQSLASWLGGATGYVTTWYDQSGRGNHMAQATASNQPRVNLSTNPSSITMTGVEYFQNTVPFTFNFGSGAFTLRYVVSNNTGGLVLYKADSADFTWTPYEKKFWLGNGTTTETSRGGFPSQVGNSEAYVIGAAAIGSTKTSVVHKATAVNTSVPIYVNGTIQSLSLNNINMKTDPGNFLYFGRGGNASNYIGNLHEIQIFSTALSDTDRLALEN